MFKLVESVKTNGVLTPAILRPKENGRYEMVSGHRRKRACELAQMDTIKCEVRDLTDDEAIAAFSTSVDEGKGFRYYDFVNAYGSEDYDSFIKSIKKLSYYDTGKTAEFGDKLITLSTCEYTHSNGRMVVVAKRLTRR